MHVVFMEGLGPPLIGGSGAAWSTTTSCSPPARRTWMRIEKRSAGAVHGGGPNSMHY